MKQNTETGMNYHDAANAFPMMDEKRFAELKSDISERGQIDPITIYEGEILDGRNRYRACVELGMSPKTREYDGNPWRYAWSVNGERRDIVQEQRYLIWKFCHGGGDKWEATRRRIADEANRKRSEAATERGRGGDGTLLSSSGTLCSTSEDRHEERQAKAAASNTNRGAVSRGDVLDAKRPDLAEKVRQGAVKPAEAHRQMRRDAVAGKVADLPADQFVVLYADPPWKYGDSQAVKGDFGTGTGAADGHYPTMSTAELRALDVPSIAAPDAVLFLWATSPLLEDALSLCSAWGFKYKAQFVWDKVKHNMGHYNSVRHELLLICTRGSCTPQNVKLFDSVQSIERTVHSRKPEQFREIIDTIYPHGNRMEMFCRGDAPDGWTAWGNESQ